MAAVPLLVRARVAVVGRRVSRPWRTVIPPRRPAALVGTGDRDCSAITVSVRHARAGASVTLAEVYAIAGDYEIEAREGEAFGFARALTR
jgi:hypothetical protein